jgi:hypothetical protein
MGNFAYVNKGAKAEEHETGHTLGVAAFGSIAFGAISGIEDAITHTSYSEHLAESHDPTPANPQAGTWWHMWDA